MSGSTLGLRDTMKTHYELKKLRKEMAPYIETIFSIGGAATKSIFDGVWDQDESDAGFEEDDSWMARLLAKITIDGLIEDQEQSRKDVTHLHQSIVEKMAGLLCQSLKTRALIVEGYAPSMTTDYVISEFVIMAINDSNLDRAIIAWRLLENLSMRFGSAVRRLTPVFTLARKEITESQDASYATFVLIANLGDRRIDQMLLRKIGAGDSDEWWWGA